jgi:hypothetical protein
MASGKGPNGEDGTGKERRRKNHPSRKRRRRKGNEDEPNPRKSGETWIWEKGGRRDVEREKTTKKEESGRPKGGKTTSEI